MLPTDEARWMLSVDCALSSCFSFPSGSAEVATAARLKSILADAAAETSGWLPAGAATARGRLSLA